MTSIPYDPSPDPLYREVILSHHTTIPVLGFPVRFASNAPAVIELAEEAFGAWRVLEEYSELLEPDQIRVDLVVHPGQAPDAEHAEFVYRFIGNHRLLIGGPGSVAFSDPAARHGIGYVIPQLVEDRQHFRYGFLEALTLSIVTRMDRQPLHAAALARGGAGVIIAGRSGVGKSSLAYAAATSGLPVLAEDTVYVQSDPDPRIWGLPGFLHLPVEARDRFQELRASTPTLLANGKSKFAIDLRTLGALPDRPMVDRAALCVLERCERTDLIPIDPEIAVKELTHSEEEGFDEFTETLRAPVSRLATRGAWRLQVSRDPFEALPLLERLLDSL